MDSPWKLLGTLAGCIVVDVAFHMLADYFRKQGYNNALEDLENGNAYVMQGKKGEPVIIVVNGEKFYLRIEPINK